jgi:hypothetical protein
MTEAGTVGVGSGVAVGTGVAAAVELGVCNGAGDTVFPGWERIVAALVGDSEPRASVDVSVSNGPGLDGSATAVTVALCDLQPNRNNRRSRP